MTYIEQKYIKLGKVLTYYIYTNFCSILVTNHIKTKIKRDGPLWVIIYTTHNLISIIALISIGLTAMSLPLRYSITASVCLRFHRNSQW